MQAPKLAGLYGSTVHLQDGREAREGQEGSDRPTDHLDPPSDHSDPLTDHSDRLSDHFNAPTRHVFALHDPDLWMRDRLPGMTDHVQAPWHHVTPRTDRFIPDR